MGVSFNYSSSVNYNYNYHTFNYFQIFFFSFWKSYFSCFKLNTFLMLLVLRMVLNKKTIKIMIDDHHYKSINMADIQPEIRSLVTLIPAFAINWFLKVVSSEESIQTFDTFKYISTFCNLSFCFMAFTFLFLQQQRNKSIVSINCINCINQWKVLFFEKIFLENIFCSSFLMFEEENFKFQTHFFSFHVHKLIPQFVCPKDVQ